MNSVYLRAESLRQVQLDEEQIILVDVRLNNTTITRSIDVYQINDKLLVAIEPLFDGLKIRYSITDSSLSIWKNEQVIPFNLEQQSNVPSDFLWATDGFYFFTELALIKKLFPAKMEFLNRTLELKLTTAKDELVFPVQKLAQQATQRTLNRFTGDRYEFKLNKDPITIADQYRLFTVPHGRVLLAAETDKNSTGFNGSVQLVSDLLYHSANLTLSDTNNSDLAARLVLSRFKSAPNKPILGLYDQYQLGDVSSVTNGISTNTSGGIGFKFDKLGAGDYRRSNQAINLQEIAPPGWEAELFRNNIFLAATTVPNDGLLNFDDVEVEYGLNNYEIKLYGPYGETQVRKKSLDLTKNALNKGQFTHSFYALDSNHRLINDQSDADYKLTDYGATFGYGVTDNWQIGFGFAGIENEQQFYNITNALTFPGMLFENDLSVDQDGNYAQITSLKGRLFSRDSYTLEFESSDNFTSNRISSPGKNTSISGAYSRPTDFANINFSASFSESDLLKRSSVGNRISGNIGQLIIRHDLNYTSITTDKLESNSISGTLGLSGSLPYDFRISANLRYQPEEDDIISKASSLILQRNLRDSWDGYHSFSVNYLPFAESTANWRVGHRAAWQADEFQLNVSTNYDEFNKWSFQLGIQLFLGYDYQNNKFLFNKNIQSNTATLDIHTYLDRQLNGVPDPLDYNLADVEFYGSPEWASLTSGQNGRTVLPGVTAITPFSFVGKWKQGSNTINNDYLVYTHPGAYIDVNMPFVLSTDIIGFVLRTQNGQEVGIQNISMELIDSDGEFLQTIETDLDGYYEFNGLSPGKFTIRVTESNLREQGYTSQTIGYSLLTGGQGGFSELPTIKLRRVNDDSDPMQQAIVTHSLNSKNSEPVIWDEDPEKRQNYFTLPTKDKVMAKHSLALSKQNENSAQSQESIAIKKPESAITKTAATVPQKFSFLQNQKTENGLPSLSVSTLPERDFEPAPSSLEDTFSSETAGKAVEPILESIEPIALNGTIEKQYQDSSNSAPTLAGDFIIQLGAYTSEQVAQNVIKRLNSAKLPAQNFDLTSNDINTLLRLSYGHFESMQEALTFANQNIGQEQTYFVRKEFKNAKKAMVKTKSSISERINTKKSGWVIQFYASNTAITSANLPIQYNKISNAQTATKTMDDGRTLYCLISQVYPGKKSANNALATSGVTGWVTSSSAFRNIASF